MSKEAKRMLMRRNLVEAGHVAIAVHFRPEAVRA